jgi:hypothetical protein
MVDIDRLKPMRLDVLKRLHVAVGINLADLRDSKFGRLNTVAWLSRNILELATWSGHCAQSEENSKQFVLDSARDVNDVMNIPDGMFSTTFSFRDARQENLDRAQDDGFTSLDESYTAVSKVARQLGVGEVFRNLNKLFSKFAHPTALSIIYTDGAVSDKLRDKFYNIGVEMAENTLKTLDEALAQITSGGLRNH